MKSLLVSFLNRRFAASIGLALCVGNTVWAKPSIQSIDVSPTPLVTGHNFTVTVASSPDVTQATATVDFHPGSRFLEIPLVKRGQVWTGSGLVPSDIRHELPGTAGAMVSVSLFDANCARTQKIVHVGLAVETISAILEGSTLTVTGDDHDNTIVVSRDIAGTILINGGAVLARGGTPTVANTTLIRILGLAGNDNLTIDDANGQMPPANLFGGDGDDILTGSASDDMLDGGPGDDTLLGRGGNDLLLGGPGNDILNGGQGVDQLLGGDGDDQIIWNPGDGSDVVEGGNGQDTLVFNGSNANEFVDLSSNGSRLRFFRNVGNITMDCGGVEQVIFNAAAGADNVNVGDLTGTEVTNVVVDLTAAPSSSSPADTISVSGTGTNDSIIVTGTSNKVDVLGLSATVTVLGGVTGLDSLTINALGGDDIVDASGVQAGAIDLTLNGGAGNDRLIGGQGNDVLNGGPGIDTELGGAGDDVFVWNPGDGNDVIEGQDGQDTLLFNGANIDEVVDLSANGQRLRFFRNVANITMDCNGVEVVQFNARGGADSITVNDLTGTSVQKVNLDLAGQPTSGIGDNAADSVIVNGTAGNDAITISGTSAGVNVTGLSASVNIVGSEGNLDQLVVNALGGDDVVEASGLAAGVINLTVDGGPGDDVIIGSAGPDVLLGGEGDDILNGGPGLDTLDGGPGNNVLIQD